MTTLSDYVVSVLRTVVPATWGTALAWLVSVGVLDQAAADGPGAGAGGFLILLAIGLWYALVRLAEPHLPAWVAVLLLGGARAPQYLGTVPVGATQVWPGPDRRH